MGGVNIGRRLELLNRGFSDDVIDTLIRKYTFLRSDLEARFRAFHAAKRTNDWSRILSR